MSSSNTNQMDQELVYSSLPYAREAFVFVQEGLGYTVSQIYGDPEKLDNEQRHISGQQLCIGLRDYAIKRYGLMARSVLAHWNIQRTDDFGRIVYAMIQAGTMSSAARDSLEDFYAVYRFEDAFDTKRVLGLIGAN